MLQAAGAIRNLGPTSWQVADVTSGRLDGFWEFGRDAGNLLGTALIARQAGAVVSGADGGPWDPMIRRWPPGFQHRHAEDHDLQPER